MKDFPIKLKPGEKYFSDTSEFREMRLRSDNAFITVSRLALAGLLVWWALAAIFNNALLDVIGVLYNAALIVTLLYQREKTKPIAAMLRADLHTLRSLRQFLKTVIDNKFSLGQSVYALIENDKTNELSVEGPFVVSEIVEMGFKEPTYRLHDDTGMTMTGVYWLESQLFRTREGAECVMKDKQDGKR